MSQNLSSAAVVIGALRVNKEQNRVDYGTNTFKVHSMERAPHKFQPNHWLV